MDGKGVGAHTLLPLLGQDVAHLVLELAEAAREVVELAHHGLEHALHLAAALHVGLGGLQPLQLESWEAAVLEAIPKRSATSIRSGDGLPQHIRQRAGKFRFPCTHSKNSS